MKKWAYMIITIENLEESDLDRLGEQGWELVTVIGDIKLGYTVLCKAFFKREIIW